MSLSLNMSQRAVKSCMIWGPVRAELMERRSSLHLIQPFMTWMPSSISFSGFTKMPSNSHGSAKSV
eukprot:3114814-Lingulodinium_polyedra.AAC.1